jgi:hypothetical protein
MRDRDEKARRIGHEPGRALTVLRARLTGRAHPGQLGPGQAAAQPPAGRDEFDADLPPPRVHDQVDADAVVPPGRVAPAAGAGRALEALLDPLVQVQVRAGGHQEPMRQEWR